MITQETIQLVERHLAGISLDPKFKLSAISVVQKKLGRMIYAKGEVQEIASDAVMHVIANLLEALQKGTSEVFSESNLAGREVTQEDVRGYVMMGVTNYCNTRAERWSTNKSAPRSGKKGDQAKKSTPPSQSSGLEDIAVRARQPILSTNPFGTEFWDANIQVEMDHGINDADRLTELLIARGLTEEEIDLITNHLAGITFAHMARESGGTADKYRKIYDRALAKANLEL